MADVVDKFCEDEGDQILVKLAMRNQFVCEAQVRQASALQQEERTRGRNLSIGDIMMEKNMISRKQLDYLQATKTFLVMRQSDGIFVKIAVMKNLVSQEQVDKAAQLQAKTFKETKVFRPIGELLVEAGFLTPQKKAAVQTMIERIKKERSPGAEAERKGAAPAAPLQQMAEASSQQQSENEDEEFARTLTGRVVADETFYEIIVSEDSIRAYLRIKGDLPESIGLEDIKKLLVSLGINYGVVDDTLIDGYIRLKGAQRRPLRIAEGQLPKAGKDAEIRYFFKTDPLSLDIIEEDNVIDLKNRGGVPQVKQGDLLAEKCPRVPEVPGTDVYGKKLGAAQVKDIRLMIGTGAELSKDGLKAYAKIDGRPELSALGKLSVLPELHIDGDVSFETGNIAFEGSIIVRGVVQDGFRVKGRALTAKEIAKAEVDVAGDVTAYGGILGANIRCQGNVRAVHIHTAKIEAQGNVTVEKGIFDSRIHTSGKCVAERGKIISSKIIAKMGVEASFVGSDIALPSTLVLGVDPLTEKQLESLKASIVAKEKEKIQHKELIEKLEEQSSQAEIRIGELAQIQDRGALKKKSLREKLEEVKKLADSEKIAKVESVLQDLDSKIRSAEEELEKLFDRQDEIKGKIQDHSERIKEADEEIRKINDEMDILTQWVKDNPGLAALKVFNTAHAGTIIRGPFSATTLSSNAKSALIRETQDSDSTEGGTPGKWRISVQSLY